LIELIIRIKAKRFGISWFQKCEYKNHFKSNLVRKPMDGFPLAGDMKYYGIIIAKKIKKRQRL
jgi:hypothetical protein